MKKLLFIYNVHAGKGHVRLRLPELLEIFTQAGWLVTAHPTQGAEDATRMAAELGGEFDRIVCAGGDGTLHEVVDGLMLRTDRPELGYVPAGTTNDFSKNLRLPRGTANIARTAAAGVPRQVDIGRFNGRDFFIYVAAFGAFTDVAYNTPQAVKRVFGHMGYVLESATRISSVRPYALPVAHDGGVIRGEYCYGMVSNTISVGGFKGNPAQPVALDDGLFEVCLVRVPKTPLQLQGVAKGLLQLAPDDQGMVDVFRTAKLKISCPDALPWTLDGEFGGDHTQIEIENCQRAVTIVYGR